MASTRRVKKGPGRRPQSAKRKRFMELRARGWSIRAAAREVGVARTTGKNWANGYKTYRKDGTVGWVPPLDPLVERQISPRFLSQEERIEIAELVLAGLSIRKIAQRLGRSPSTISRELRRDTRMTASRTLAKDPAADGRHGNRNKGLGSGRGAGRRSYRPFEAHRHATSLRARRHLRRVERDLVLGQLVGDLLAQRWSPQQISRHLRRRFPQEPAKWLCPESIYQAIYQPGSVLRRPSALAPHRRSPLRTGRDHRRAHQKVDRRRPRFEQPMLSIHQRPFGPADRSQVGHWEGDLIIGKSQGSAIGTLVERQTRMLRLLHLPQRDGESLHAALVARMGDLPSGLLRTITWDQGTEMAGHLTIAKSLGAAVYFCDSHSPWQRGSNENANGVLRDYFPKGTDLSVHSVEHLLAVENEINNRPRMVLEDNTPTELFTALLASENQSMLRR